LTQFINNDLTDEIVSQYLKYIENSVLPDYLKIQNTIVPTVVLPTTSYNNEHKRDEDDEQCRTFKRKRYT